MITAQAKVQDYGKGSSELAFLERVLRLGGRQQLLAPRVECRKQIGLARRAPGGGRRDLGCIWATRRRLKQRRDEFWCIVAESRRDLWREDRVRGLGYRVRREDALRPRGDKDIARAGGVKSARARTAGVLLVAALESAASEMSGKMLLRPT